MSPQAAANGFAIDMSQVSFSLRKLLVKAFWCRKPVCNVYCIMVCGSCRILFCCLGGGGSLAGKNCLLTSPNPSPIYFLCDYLANSSLLLVFYLFSSYFPCSLIF